MPDNAADPGPRLDRSDFNRDNEMKPGRPPRPASEPEGAGGSMQTDKTLTDPGTGEPQPGAPEPAGSEDKER